MARELNELNDLLGSLLSTLTGKPGIGGVLHQVGGLLDNLLGRTPGDIFIQYQGQMNVNKLVNQVTSLQNMGASHIAEIFERATELILRSQNLSQHEKEEAIDNLETAAAEVQKSRPNRSVIKAALIPVMGALQRVSDIEGATQFAQRVWDVVRQWLGG